MKPNVVGDYGHVNVDWVFYALLTEGTYICLFILILNNLYSRMTGLWVPGIHNDVGFCSFDVNSSYRITISHWN